MVVWSRSDHFLFISELKAVNHSKPPEHLTANTSILTHTDTQGQLRDRPSQDRAHTKTHTIHHWKTHTHLLHQQNRIKQASSQRGHVSARRPLKNPTVHFHMWNYSLRPTLLGYGAIMCPLRTSLGDELKYAPKFNHLCKTIINCYNCCMQLALWYGY